LKFFRLRGLGRGEGSMGGERGGNRPFLVEKRGQEGKNGNFLKTTGEVARGVY